MKEQQPAHLQHNRQQLVTKEGGGEKGMRNRRTRTEMGQTTPDDRPEKQE